MPRILEALLIPFVALLVSLLLFGLFVLAAGHNPLEVYYTIYRGAFGSWFSWQNTLVRAAPLMLTALCTALPARVGLIVIGGEGAVVVGGLAAALIGIALNGMLPPLWVITLMTFTAMLAGGAWIGAVGALKHYRGVNETISSLLLNYIAIAVLNFLIIGMLRDPASLNKPASYPIGDANMIGAIGDSSVHWGLVYGIVACIGLWFLVRRTSFGFAMDITGGNQRAARLMGLPTAWVVVTACVLGGAAAGVAGMLEIAAVHGRVSTSLNAGYGYAGILVAFLARHNPLAIILVALLLGGISASGGLLQRSHELPDATVLVLQGIIFVVILAGEAFYGRLSIFQPKSRTA